MLGGTSVPSVSASVALSLEMGALSSQVERVPEGEMMKCLKVIVSVVIVGWTGLACSDGPSQRPPDSEQVLAQAIDQGAPTQSIGMAPTVLGAISLATYADALKDGELRAREVVLQPGATIAVHSHDSRPAVVYVLEGELVEHRSDSEDPVIRRQGDVYFEGPEVVHWSENLSPNRVRVLAVDIISNDPE